MDFRILGPFEVIEQDRDVAPRRAQQRALLAMLVIRRNEIVSTDDLVEAIWGDDPPVTAQTALQGHVSALRKTLGTDRIETRPPGYRLHLDIDELDAERFEAQIATARATNDPVERGTLLGDALTLWRGAPLAEFVTLPVARPEIARLEELRGLAVEERMQAELDRGTHQQLVPELERLLIAEPLRERLRGQLMVALYRSGRHADALHVYQAGRKAASEELGLDPGPMLQTLERQILARDPALDLQKPTAPKPEQARKFVTVLIAEATPSASTDPEEFSMRLDPILSRARDVMESFGGSVEPLFTNALVAVFGAPQAHEDDPERAVRAALAVRDSASGGGPGAIRIGIDAGRALVTVTGRRVEVTGDVLARASRLQTVAPAGGVTVSDVVQSTTAAAVEYAPLASDTWLAGVLREAARSRADGGGAVPFVGREHELAVLRRSYEQTVSSRASQLVTVIGEPGAGKTRLLAEFHGSLAKGEVVVNWREGRCLPYGDGVTLWALGEILKSHAGILETDDPPTSVQKLRTALDSTVDLEEERIWLAECLAPLVGVTGSAAAGRDESFAAALRFIEAVAIKRPAVLAFEDLQWADPALLQFIDRLVDHAAAVPLLVIVTARFELFTRNPSWGGGKRNATAITLPPLGEGDTGRIFKAILGDDSTPDEVVRRAGGNPLFAQELARIATSRPAVTGGGVPISLEAVIAARLDTLPSALRETAADAAVVGEVFWPGAVAAISGLGGREVDERIQRLVSADFVRRRRGSSVRREDEYAFLHALVRDVAYEQIPRRARAKKHEAAAKWIEALAGDRVTDHAEFIAHHYLEALGLRGESAPVDDLKRSAARFLKMAGDKAVHFDVSAAERFYRRALELVSVEDPNRPAIVVGLATSVQEAGRLRESVSLYEEAITGLDAQGSDIAASRARLELARALWNIGETGRHRLLVEETVQRLEHGPIGPELARAWLFKGRDLVMQSGSARASLPWTQRAIDAAERVRAPDVKVRALQFRGLARWELGDPNGVEDLEEALRLGREAGVGFETAICYSNLAEIVARRDGPAKGLPVYRDGIAFAEQRGLVYAAMWMRGSEPLLLFEVGKWDEVLGGGSAVLEWDRAQGTTQITMLVLAAQLDVLVNRGLLDRAEAVASELEPLARRIGDVQAIMQSFPPLAQLAVAKGDSLHARELMREAGHASEQNPAWRSHRIADCVRICVAAGDLALGKELLENVDTTVTRAKATVTTARGALAEAEGELQHATDRFADAIGLWRAFGFRLELGHALLGRGRTLITLGRAKEASAYLGEAGAIFSELGAGSLAASVADALVVTSARG